MELFKKRLTLYGLVGGGIFVFLLIIILFFSKKSAPAKSTPPENVVLPTIYNGQLVLPSTVTSSADNNLSRNEFTGRLAVGSANLAAVFDKDGKLTGIRILGEITNVSDLYATKVSPVVRFYDAQNKIVGQKIGRLTSGFDFFELASHNRSVYDVTVDNPPASDKLEILFNITQSSPSASFAPLKIGNRNLETKTATINSQESQEGQGVSGNQENQGTESGEASSSATATSSAAPVPAGEKVAYYVVSGQVVNSLENPVTDITVYAWAKNDEDKVFALGRTDFKNDLLKPGETVSFKVLLVPIKSDQTLITYEIAAWGKEYQLNIQ